MSATSFGRSMGFVTCAANVAASTSRRSSSRANAVSAIAGVAGWPRCDSRARTSRIRSKPLFTGMARSVTRTDGRSRSNSTSAWSTEVAVRTTAP